LATPRADQRIREAGSVVNLSTESGQAQETERRCPVYNLLSDAGVNLEMVWIRRADCDSYMVRQRRERQLRDGTHRTRN